MVEVVVNSRYAIREKPHVCLYQWHQRKVGGGGGGYENCSVETEETATLHNLPIPQSLTISHASVSPFWCVAVTIKCSDRQKVTWV